MLRGSVIFAPYPILVGWQKFFYLIKVMGLSPYDFRNWCSRIHTQINLSFTTDLHVVFGRFDWYWCYVPIVRRQCFSTPSEAILSLLRKNFMCLLVTDTIWISVLKAVVFVSVIILVTVVAMSAWPSCYNNYTDRWLPTLPASQHEINESANFFFFAEGYRTVAESFSFWEIPSENRTIQIY
jgi:hypothetical protein